VNHDTNKPSQEAKKKSGSFYTPDELIAVLTNWSIRSSEDNILEPSFGGCGFVEESMKRLIELGCDKPESNIYGCDIDPNAFSFLDRLLPRRNGNFLIGDFLNKDISSFDGVKFSVILGNPPYISHHNTTGQQKESARNCCSDLKLNISSRASLWAYFVVHSTKFLRHAGRMAFVLPGSFLQADYASEVRSHIQRHFDSISAIVLHDRLFLSEGTEENTVILLTDGFRESVKKTVPVNVSEAKTIDDLKLRMGMITDGKLAGSKFEVNVNRTLMNHKCKSLFDCISRSNECFEAGVLFSILIGIVTGDNSYFVISKGSAEDKFLYPQYVRPVLAKITDAPGLVLKKDDFLKTLNSDKPCLLINTSRLEKNKDKHIRDYLASYPRSKRKSIKTFRRRKVWHSPDDFRIPDAFFTYMKQECPRIVLNDHKINCTNSIHRIYFNRAIAPEKYRLVALSLLTSFSQLSAEVEGKGYGSGVLKLEPNSVKRIKLLIPAIEDYAALDQAFKIADGYLRSGNAQKAIATADDFILRKIEERDEVDYRSVFQAELERAQRRRQHIRTKKG
jgi:adenine-specific DNA methylase